MLAPWHLWLMVGILLWIAEIFTPGFVVGVFGTACLLVAPFSALGASLTLQILVFGLSTAILALGVRPLVLKYLYRPKINTSTNVDSLVGRTAIVVEPIDPVAGTGRVKVHGDIWRAVTPDDTSILTGTKVRIQQVEGCTLIVQTIEERSSV